MKKLGMALFIILILNLLIPHTALCAELNGWIKGDTCWVVKTPKPDAQIIDIIIKKSSWLR